VKRYILRDAVARMLHMTPVRDWAMPSTVSGRFCVRVSRVHVILGRRLLRSVDLGDMAECLTVDPYSTAVALAERFARSPLTPPKEEPPK
jgi:hypothetical protein